MWIECQSCKGDGSHGLGCACMACPVCHGIGQVFVVVPAKPKEYGGRREVRYEHQSDPLDPTEMFSDPRHKKQHAAA